MSTTTEVDELHQLIAGLRRCVTSLVSRYGDTPATRRIVNDAERILNGIDRLDIDVEELEMKRGLSQPKAVRRDDPDPRHRVRHRFLAGRRPRRHRRAERRLRAHFAHSETQIGNPPVQRGGCRSAPLPGLLSRLEPLRNHRPAVLTAASVLPQAALATSGVSEETTYEGLKTSCRRWHGDMTDIVDQQ